MGVPTSALAGQLPTPRGSLPRRCLSFVPTLIHSFFFFVFCLFRAPAVYGGSQAGGRIRAVAAGLPCSHSKAGSEPHL